MLTQGKLQDSTKVIITHLSDLNKMFQGENGSSAGFSDDKLNGTSKNYRLKNISLIIRLKLNLFNC